MRIQVNGCGHHISILLPTNLIFSKGTVWLANRYGRKYAADAMKDISPEALDKLFAEFRRIKHQHKHWVLVEVKSSHGEEVSITL